MTLVLGNAAGRWGNRQEAPGSRALPEAQVGDASARGGSQKVSMTGVRQSRIWPGEEWREDLESAYGEVVKSKASWQDSGQV